MKQLLIAVVFIAASCKLNAQIISVKKGELNIHPLIAQTTSQLTQEVEITVVLKLPPNVAAPAAKKKVPVILNAPRSSVKPSLTKDSIEIEPADWPSPSTKDTTTKEVVKTVNVQISAVSSFEKDENFWIQPGKLPDSLHSDNCGDCSFQVNVTAKTDYNPNKPFWVEIGSNFDLVDGLEPNNFFSGVFFYKRDIRPVFYKSADKKTNQFSNNLAVFAGVYESKTITSVSQNNLVTRSYYDTTSIIPTKPDYLKVYNGIGQNITQTTVRNISLFFSPQVRLTNHSSNEDGFHAFLALWTELQWQRIHTENNFKQLTVLKTDTVLMANVLSSTTYGLKNQTSDIDVKSHYLGFGLPIFYRQTVNNDIVQLFVNPVFGATNQPTAAYIADRSIYDYKVLQNPALEPPKRKWHAFYIVQFRLNEESYGFAVTGEVRGILFKKDNPPFVSLSLTKKFDLTKFIEFNK